MRRLAALLITSLTLLATGLAGVPFPTGGLAPAGAEPIGGDPDPDPEPILTSFSFQQSTLSTYEGGVGATTAVNLGVELSEPQDKTVTVDYATLAGTATANSDYTHKTGTLSFAPGQTLKTFAVDILGDWAHEPNEKFTVKLGNASNGIDIVGGTATITIVNDDSLIRPINDSMSVAEGSGTTGLIFGVQLASKAVTTVTVDWATQDGTAKAGSDYVTTSGTLTFAPNEATKYVDIYVKGDSLYEPDEYFTVALTNATGGELEKTFATITILNDDPFVPTLWVDPITVDEGDSGTTIATVTAKLSGAHTSPVTASYATSPGSATAPADYTHKAGQITIPAGQVSATIDIPVVGDTVYEATETFDVTLSSVQNAYAGNLTAAVTITNDDALPPDTPAWVTGIALTEGDSGTKNAVAEVTLQQARPIPTTIHYTTEDMTAKAGSDYTATTWSVVLPAGHTKAFLTVPVTGDTLVEGTEYFKVTITSTDGLTFANPSATMTIVDDDAVVLSAKSARKYEGGAGTTRTVDVAITLSAPAAVDQHFPYRTVDGTARAGSDYLAATGTLTIPTGATTATVPVTLLGDNRPERDETFYLKLDASTNTLSNQSQATVTIANDDKPKISVGTATIDEGHRGTRYVKIPVRLSAAAPWDTRVTFTTANGTAKAGSDYKARTVTVTIPAGRTRTTVSVAVIGDTVREPNEYFYAKLANASGARWGTRTAKVTIRNDD